MTLTTQHPVGGGAEQPADALRAAMLAMLSALDVAFVLYDDRGVAQLSNDAMRRLVPDRDLPLVGRDQRSVLALVSARCSDVSARRLLTGLDQPAEGLIETADDPPDHFEWRRLHLGGWVADTFRQQTAAREIERHTVDFVSGAAHDLKTPITSIKGYAQLSLRRASQGDPRLRQNLRGIADQSDRLVRLIDTIVDISRVRLGRFELHRTTFDLGEVVRGLAAVHQAWTDTHSFDVVVDPDPLIFTGDVNRLRRTIESLIDNALKFSPSGGVVRIAACEAGNRLQIAIEDEGVGISEAAKAQVYNAVWARPGSGAARPKRAGLSLPMALRVVEEHGGVLRLDSGPEVGTRAVIDLPRSPGTS